jgi:DNA-binding FrmR family transcriptional regulator
MIETGRYCIGIAQQLNAAIAALRRVQSDMLRDHLRACVEASLEGHLPDTERRRIIKEVTGLLARPS